MGVATHAEAVAVNRLAITGWDMGIASSLDFPTWVHQQVNVDLVMGTYRGNPQLEADGLADIGSGVVGGIADFGVGLTGVHAGAFTTVGAGSPPPTGDVAGGVLTLDLSSWLLFADPHEPGGPLRFDGGGSLGPATPWSTPVTTSYDPASRMFTADWTYKDTRGFGGLESVYTWHLGGVVHLVPEPASIALVGTAVAGLVGLRRRRAFGSPNSLCERRQR
jgi:hypothetical protein